MEKRPTSPRERKLVGKSKSTATGEANGNHATIGIMHGAAPGDEATTDGFSESDDRALYTRCGLGQHQLSVAGVFATQLVSGAISWVIVTADDIAIGLPGEGENGTA